MPQFAPKKLRNTLDFSHPQDFFEGLIDRCRVSLQSQFASCLFEERFIKHKICTFHVYSVPNSDPYSSVVG